MTLLSCTVSVAEVILYTIYTNIDANPDSPIFSIDVMILLKTFNFQVFSLLLLSIVPSIEDFALHKLAFGSFLFFSAL